MLAKTCLVLFLTGAAALSRSSNHKENLFKYWSFVNKPDSSPEFAEGPRNFEQHTDTPLTENGGDDFEEYIDTPLIENGGDLFTEEQFQTTLASMQVHHIGQGRTDCQLDHVANSLHVISSGDRQFLKMVVTSMFSLVKNTKSPERLVYHVVVKEDDAAEAAKFLHLNASCHVRKVGGAQVIVQYLGHVVDPLIPHVKKARLASASNFVRFALDRFVTSAGPGDAAIVSWLDADMHFQSDVMKEADRLRSSDRPAMMVDKGRAHRHPFNRTSNKVDVHKCKHALPHLKKVLYDGLYLQANVVFMKLSAWTAHDYNNLVPKLVRCQNKGVWASGSQMIMDVMVQYPRPGSSSIEKLVLMDKPWNEGVGSLNKKGDDCVQHDAGVHWNTRTKPFTKGAICQKIWDNTFAELQTALHQTPTETQADDSNKLSESIN